MPVCALCSREVETLSYVAKHWLLDRIRKEHPDWVQEDGTCPKCLAYYKKLDDVVAVDPDAQEKSWR